MTSVVRTDVNESRFLYMVTRQQIVVIYAT